MADSEETDRAVWWAFAAVFLLTLLCFLPDLSNSLLDWDDAGYINENLHIRSISLETFGWAFGEFHLNYWAPLTWLSLAVDYAIWGVNPLGYHLTNDILHALSSGIFFLICLQLLKFARQGAQRAPASPCLRAEAPFGAPAGLPCYGVGSQSRQGQGAPTANPGSLICCALLAAAVFAIHPLRVESVAWATERKDVLSLFFGLPAVLAYLRWVRSSAVSGGRAGLASPYYWLSLGLFALSLLSKSLLVTLPVVLLVLDWYPLKRWQRPGLGVVLMEKLPFFLLSGLCSMLTMKAQAKAIISFDQINLFTRMLVAFRSIALYLKLTVWPLELSPFYVHPMNIPAITIEYAWPILVFCLITLCCLLLVKRLPMLTAVWGIYLVTLLPFLGFTQVGAQAMAGRFTYLAGLPLALLFSVGVTTAWSRWKGAKLARAALCGVVALVLLVGGYRTVREIAFWRDDVTLWTRVIDLSPHSTGRAYFQRCNAYRLRGAYPEALRDVNQAIAIASAKRYGAMHELYQMRADTYAKLGDLGGALSDYTLALSTADAGRRPYLYLQRSEIYRRSGLEALAAKDLNEASSLKGSAAAASKDK